MIGFLPQIIIITLMKILPTILMVYWFPSQTPYLLMFYMLIGLSTAYVQSFLLNRIVRQVLLRQSAE